MVVFFFCYGCLVLASTLALFSGGEQRRDKGHGIHCYAGLRSPLHGDLETIVVGVVYWLVKFCHFSGLWPTMKTCLVFPQGRATHSSHGAACWTAAYVAAISYCVSLQLCI